jgi:hypothetical protein
LIYFLYRSSLMWAGGVPAFQSWSNPCQSRTCRGTPCAACRPLPFQRATRGVHRGRPSCRRTRAASRAAGEMSVDLGPEVRSGSWGAVPRTSELASRASRAGLPLPGGYPGGHPRNLPTEPEPLAGPWLVPLSPGPQVRQEGPRPPRHGDPSARRQDPRSGGPPAPRSRVPGAGAVGPGPRPDPRTLRVSTFLSPPGFDPEGPRPQ